VDLAGFAVGDILAKKTIRLVHDEGDGVVGFGVVLD
jgi:hypothetical protein